MKIKNTAIWIGFIIVLSSYVNAVSIGISPGKLKFENVLRGGYSEKAITLSTAADEGLSVTFKVQGEIRDWISFDTNQTFASISKASPYRLKVIARPPADARTGNYTGSIEFLGEATGGISGRAGTLVKTAVTLIVNLEVTGKEIIACRAGGFNFRDAEIGFPLEYGYTIINDGNVRLSPLLEFDVYDQLQKNLVWATSVQGEEVLPTTERSFSKGISSSLPEGQYWINFKIGQCNKASSLLTFSILEKGAIADNGDLMEIIANPWSYANETLQIKAKFRNSGKRSVTARFKGAIRLNERIVKLIETEDVIVAAGEASDFDIFFTPQAQGRYTITGRVVYNKKLTFEKEAVFNVNPTQQELKAKKFSFVPLPLLLYIIIITAIVFIVRKIMKERRR